MRGQNKTKRAIRQKIFFPFFWLTALSHIFFFRRHRKQYFFDSWLIREEERTKLYGNWDLGRFSPNLDEVGTKFAVGLIVGRRGFLKSCFGNYKNDNSSIFFKRKPLWLYSIFFGKNLVRKNNFVIYYSTFSINAFSLFVKVVMVWARARKLQGLVPQVVPPAPPPVGA